MRTSAMLPANCFDQLNAIGDVLSDLAAGKPMDRLICGDVGFGKTEVALRAAFVVAMSGRQVAIVCPTTLLEMSNALQRLGADADRLRVVFVTVDPERDTPEQLQQYLDSFDPRIIGLTGSQQQIAAAAKGWNAFHNKIPEGDGSYTVVHSAYVYLMDRNNRLTGTMGFQETEDEQVAKLKALIEGSRQ